MQTILGFVPDDRLRAIDDFCRYLFTTMGGQAVHEQRILVRAIHLGSINDPAVEGFQARCVFLLVSHAGPHIGGYEVSAFAGISRILEDGIALVLWRDQRRIDVVASRR